MRFFNTGVWLRRLRGSLLVLVFISAFLYIFSLNFKTPNKMDHLQCIVTEVASPPLQLVGRVFASFEGFFKNYILLTNLHTENESLKTRIARLQSQLISYQEAYVENQRLRRLLDFKKSTGYQTIAAQVVVHDLTGWFQTLIVDKGSSDGVAADMPVVNEEGVIGRILDVSSHYSRVLLITDQGSAVDTIDVRNRVRGILCGKDINGCVLKYVSANLDIEEGDLMITSGKDGVFPKGLSLGIVHSVYKDPASMFQRIDVKPLVQLSTLEEVLIIKRGKIGMGPLENARPGTDESEGGKKPSGTSSSTVVRKKGIKGTSKIVVPAKLKRPLKLGNTKPGARVDKRAKRPVKPTNPRPGAGVDKKAKPHRAQRAPKVRNVSGGTSGPEEKRR